MLWLSSRISRWGMVLVSFEVYLAAQAFPEVLDLPELWASQNFNPFAWQFLFFVGVGLGSGRSQSHPWL
jgi:hypothetical protein